MQKLDDRSAPATTDSSRYAFINGELVHFTSKMIPDPHHVARIESFEEPVKYSL